MKKVCVINTGGTLSMGPSDAGHQPVQGYLEEHLANMDELTLAPMPEIEIIEYDPLVDSSNMTPEIWTQIATDIQDNSRRCDGFVILHGTDTMAYTASALAFMLQGLNQPVILTGAQLPLGQIRNDARANLTTAIILAANHDIPEVSLFFGDHLFRGCRSTKVSATRFEAFDSPNFPPLATAGTKIKIFENRIRESNPALDEIVVHPIESAEIASFRIFPGMSVDVFRHILQRPLKGIVLETFGDGNGPTNDPAFVAAISDAIDNGLVVLGCTQCIHGGLTQSGYATGTILTKAGVIPGRDMTIEASLVKMLYLFSQDLTIDEIKMKLAENLVGELTIPT